MKKNLVYINLAALAVCCLVSLISVMQVSDLLSALEIVDYSSLTVSSIIVEKINNLVFANSRIQIALALFACFSAGAVYASLQVYRDLKDKISSLKGAVKEKKSIIKEKSELVEILSSGVEIGVVILNKNDEFKWGNSRFGELFNIQRLTDKSKFDEFIFDRIKSVEESNGMRGAIQINGVTDQDFILRRFVDEKNGDTVYSFYPVKLYFQEYIQGQKTDSLYEELGDNIFELFSVVDEVCCSVKSHFDGIFCTVPEGRLPVLVRGAEDDFVKGLNALVKAVFYIAMKTPTKKVQIRYSKDESSHSLSFRIPNFNITSNVLEDKFAISNHGLNISEVFRKVESDLKNYGADILVKNIELFNEGNFANIELNFESEKKASLDVAGERVEL